MLQELSPAEFDAWRAYDRIEPLGLDRLERQLALIGAAICRALGGKVEPEHFLHEHTPRRRPGRGGKPQQQSAEAQLATFRAVVAAHNRGQRGRT